jgi:hypothetical protein
MQLHGDTTSLETWTWSCITTRVESLRQEFLGVRGRGGAHLAAININRDTRISPFEASYTVGYG